MGQRGPKPGSGGRPKKAIADKIADGNPGKRPLTVIDFKDSAADLEGQAMPKPSEFLSAKQKDGSTLCAAEIYENVWNWLSDRTGIKRVRRNDFRCRGEISSFRI